MATMIVEAAQRPVRDRDEVIARLREAERDVRAHHATALFVYGSTARNELREDSDVDVYVDYDADGPFSFVDLIRLEAVIEKALGRRVDFGTRNGLHPRLRENIERTSVKVF